MQNNRGVPLYARDRDLLQAGWRLRLASPLRIGVTCPLDWHRFDDSSTVLATAEVLMRAGALPVLLSGEPLETVHGLVLSGGPDIAPGSYGQPEQSEHQPPVDPQRDRMELAYARRACELSMPVLGICRGAQIFNLALGGDLTQTLSDSPVQHDQAKDGGHLVEVRRGARLASLLSDRVMVNSLHHQGIARLAEDLTATAVAEDGLVEAYEHKRRLHQVGYQFHPELLAMNDFRFQALFDVFVSQSSERAARLYDEPREFREPRRA